MQRREAHLFGPELSPRLLACRREIEALASAVLNKGHHRVGPAVVLVVVVLNFRNAHHLLLVPLTESTSNLSEKEHEEKTGKRVVMKGPCVLTYCFPHPGG